MNQTSTFFKKIVLIGTIANCISFYFAQATILVPGPGGTAPFSFPDSTTVSATILDRATGAFYVGTEGQSATVCKALRPIGSIKPTLSALSFAIGGSLPGTGVGYLALSTQEGNIYPNIAVSASLTSTEDAQFVSLIFTMTDHQTLGLAKSDILKDANNSVGEDGNTINGIVGLAANNHTIFAAVNPNEGDFGQPFGGIASVCIYRNINAVTLSQAAAQEGDSGIKALLFDNTINEIRIVTGGAPTLVLDKIDLCWDEHLQRLYAGVQLGVSASALSGGKSVVIIREKDCGVLIRQAIAPDDAISGAVIDEIVVTKQESDNLAAIHVRVMHCSTGPSYLIVNGGNDVQAATNNQVYALPLVDDPTNISGQGTLAKKDSALVNYKFITPASAAGDLATSTDAAALVGSGTLPIEGTTPISDIQIIDDVVYVSIAIASGADNDNGVFYSQAIFDENGKILRWTPWAKRAYPFNAFDDAPCDCRGVSFFAVDAVTGKVWAVDGQTKRIVRITAWNCCDTASPWTKKVGSSLTRSCYSVLDLDEGTRGFTGAGSPLDRYALFGGVNKIAMMRVSEAYIHALNSPQLVFEDMDDSHNFIEWTLPEPGGCVMHLEYARRLVGEGDTNYLFAGTPKGLFAFAKNSPVGGGFLASELGELDNTLMTNGAWNFIEAIEGSIIGLRTTGPRLYVLVYTKESNAWVYKVYGINFQTTLAAMFDASNIKLLAQSGTGAFEHVIAFTAIEPIKTGATPSAPEDKEQLVLATNNGLFRSNAVNATQAANNGIIDATSPTEAAWVQLPANNSTFFQGMTGMDAPIPGTVWPFSCEDLKQLKTFEKSRIYQISGEGDSAGTTALFNSFVPPLFNAKGGSVALSYFDPILNFWSDGARRFFVIDPADQICGSTCRIEQLMILPYNTVEWNVQSPGAGLVLGDPTVDSRKNYFWTHHIGVTGVLMVGTEKGVIALE